MTIICVDIETIGCTDPEVIAAIAATIKPPGNMKLAATIEKWTVDDKPALVQEAVLKTSFDGSVGQIVCIGLAVNDQSATAECSANEKALLAASFLKIQQAANIQYKGGGKSDAPIVIVGHNVSGFDLRFLWQRSVIHGLKPPACLLKAMKAKPWDNCIADTMLLWDADRQRKIALDALCKALGVPTPKGDMDGSKVWAAFKEGRLDEIAAYCAGDVEATRACYRRLIFAEPDLLSAAA